ncbi:HNH endonuclease family protein [Rugosimonospora acidiphila]|uniref:HNH endonuclease family protein n=1 Tax=Rugosimonospora acidiphila TaxID=556531 RepID=A0ABP9SIR3_9ACTN
MRTIRALIALFALVALSACDPSILDQGGAGASPGPIGSGPAGQGAGAAGQQLAGLTVSNGLSMSGYSREKFPHWISQGHGCDTRDVVLEHQGSGVRVTSSCEITAGDWTSPYDGKSYTDPQKLQIDHVVPLANAWKSGAKNWTTQRREEFANDLTRPQLLAVTSSLNESKGDQDPSQWRPPSRSFWCGYAEDWIAVKHYWQLTITNAEKSALSDLLGSC